MILGRSADADLAHAARALEWNLEDRDESWMVTYADLISTLLAMVVLLFGRAALTSAGPESAPRAADFASEPAPAAPPSPSATAVSGPQPGGAPAPAEPQPAEPALAAPGERLARLVEARFAGRIAAARRDEGLVLTIPEVALFASARAALQPAAAPLLAELALTLREVGEAQISVEGHTDDRPVQGGEFASNWDLAAARANAVTRYLLEQGFDALRLHSVSFADTRPVADNATAEGRAANRRVEITIEFAPPVLRDARPR